MLFKYFFFLIGFGFTVIGNVYIISYLNLMTVGYNFLEYVNFIIRRFECIMAPLGIIIIIFIILSIKEDKNELHLRYSNQFK